MDVRVFLLAFKPGTVRTVRIPDTTPESQLLETVFYYGQNDVQPQPMPSVSMGDIIEHPLTKALHRVAMMGFQNLPSGYHPYRLVGNEAIEAAMGLRPNPKKKKQSKKKPVAWYARLLPGNWYRGTDSQGKGVGVAYMGEGAYLTWERGIAEAFASLAAQQSKKFPPQLFTYTITQGLNIIDARSKIMFDAKALLGVGPWDKIDDKLFSKFLTQELQAQGVDGVIDSNPADGLVIFDKNHVQLVSKENLL